MTNEQIQYYVDMAYTDSMERFPSDYDRAAGAADSMWLELVELK